MDEGIRIQMLLLIIKTRQENMAKIGSFDVVANYAKCYNLPNAPIATCRRAATDIAPESTLIRLCHNSVLFSIDISSITSGAGHCNSGMLSTASVGTRSDMVPPCTIGNL
jgi:hypothetical protein